jgi:hypothetical protein
MVTALDKNVFYLLYVFVVVQIGYMLYAINLLLQSIHE